MRLIQKTILSVIAAFTCMASSAQSPVEYIKEDPERAAGYFHHYEEPDCAVAKKRPKGYTPFYISHFGRHGCRWHTHGDRYTGTLAILKEAENAGLLTDTGTRFLKDMKILEQDARGRAGDLTPRGTEEHREIASRMYGNYPEIFRPGAKVDSKSTPIVRCILSMTAFNEGLKEHEPELEMIRESSPKGCSYFYGNRKGKKYRTGEYLDSLRKSWIEPERFIASLFTDKGNFMNGKTSKEEFMFHSFEMAGISQCCDYLDLDLYYLFTEEELHSLWKYMNAYAYVKMGPAQNFGDNRLENIKPLLRNIVESAEDVIEGRSDIAATLRFGHDSNIIPLVALIGIDGTDARVPADSAEYYWNVSQVSPMAANLQFVFFKNKKNDIKVRVLLHERDAALPIEGAPFYDWEILKKYLKSKYENTGQGVRDYLRQDVTRTGGFFHSYEQPEASASLKKPEGYETFYISHFGRHGSRRHTSDTIYQSILNCLESAASRNLLTATGQRFLTDMRIIAEDASGRTGQLTAKGTQEQNGIARRMYGNYRELFCTGAEIDCKSTTSTRCILSMAAFSEGLKEMETGLVISREASERDLTYLRGDTFHPDLKEIFSTLDSLQKEWIDSRRFISSIFTDNGDFVKGRIKDTETLMFNCFEMASLMQDIPYLGISLYYLFTEDELYSLWRYTNALAYMGFGPDIKYGDRRLENVKPLLENIITTANKVIEGKSQVAASLRFGHDTSLIPLLTLIGIEGADIRVSGEECCNCWNSSEITPMSANIQLIFFRNKEGKIKVRVMHCEKDAKLPLKGYPFYEWNTLEKYLRDRLASIPQTPPSLP